MLNVIIPTKMMERGRTLEVSLRIGHSILEFLMLAQITCFNIEGSTGSSGKLTTLGNLVANHLETIEWLTKVLSSQSALNSAYGFT